MKPGMVTQIRVNTKDCLAILDLMGVLGVDPYDGRSFAQCVSLALSSMLQTMRDRSVIPSEEDGFQFLNRMAPFLNSGNNKRKYIMSSSLSDRMGQQSVSVKLPQHEVKNPGQYVPETVTRLQPTGWTERGATSTAATPMLLDEETKVMLAEEMKILDDKRNSVNTLTPEEQTRYDELNRILFS
jgi:hypothetical protein